MISDAALALLSPAVKRSPHKRPTTPAAASPTRSYASPVHSRAVDPVPSIFVHIDGASPRHAECDDLDSDSDGSDDSDGASSMGSGTTALNSRPLFTAGYTAHAELFGVRDTPHLVAKLTYGDALMAARRWEEAAGAYNSAWAAARREANRFVEARAGLGKTLARLRCFDQDQVPVSGLSLLRVRHLTSRGFQTNLFSDSDACCCCRCFCQHRLLRGKVHLKATPVGGACTTQEWEAVLGAEAALTHAARPPAVPSGRRDSIVSVEEGDSYHVALSSAEAQARRSLWLAEHWSNAELQATAYHVLGYTLKELKRPADALASLEK